MSKSIFSAISSYFMTVFVTLETIDTCTCTCKGVSLSTIIVLDNNRYLDETIDLGVSWGLDIKIQIFSSISNICHTLVWLCHELSALSPRLGSGAVFSTAVTVWDPITLDYDKK